MVRFNTSRGLNDSTQKAWTAARLRRWRIGCKTWPRWRFACPARQILDVSLVIDTTGSMGDEMDYLKAEFLALTRSIAESHPGVSQRWSLVVYRDDGDEYIVRWFDFREDAEAYRKLLAQQRASGGGDFPEAPDRALEVVEQLNWRQGPQVARVAFWLADAPYHGGKQNRMAELIRALKAKDIHLYPVASSGIDDLTEFMMRVSAQMTGGRYLFLTDDSGVGAAHKDPFLPCDRVTKLDQAILRMEKTELTGMPVLPTPAEILRTAGEPTQGTCTVDGQTFTLF